MTKLTEKYLKEDDKQLKEVYSLNKDIKNKCKGYIDFADEMMREAKKVAKQGNDITWIIDKMETLWGVLEDI